MAEITAQKLYQALGDSDLNFNMLEHALKGRKYFWDTVKKHDTIVLIDFSKTSDKNRFFVIDLHTPKILWKEITTHGRNSGLEKANYFSNIVNSYQSSLGFQLTAELDTSPRHDTVLILDGLEPGINDKVREREIIIHQSELARSVPVQYCSYDYIRIYGYNGQSLGCPTLRREVAKAIIDCIKNGMLLFCYAENADYFAKSIVK